MWKLCFLSSHLLSMTNFLYFLCSIENEEIGTFVFEYVWIIVAGRSFVLKLFTQAKLLHRRTSHFVFSSRWHTTVPFEDLCGYKKIVFRWSVPLHINKMLGLRPIYTPFRSVFPPPTQNVIYVATVYTSVVFSIGMSVCTILHQEGSVERQTAGINKLSDQRGYYLILSLYLRPLCQC